MFVSRIMRRVIAFSFGTDSVPDSLQFLIHAGPMQLTRLDFEFVRRDEDVGVP